ncbi:hypothetical protein Tco_0556156 [Tanacetum coccineum]
MMQQGMEVYYPMKSTEGALGRMDTQWLISKWSLTAKMVEQQAILMNCYEENSCEIDDHRFPSKDHKNLNSSLPKETSGIPVKVPNSLGPNHPARPVVNRPPSFATMLAGIPKNPSYISPDPAMVLGDECVVNAELDNCVMGEVKDFASINNLYVLLSNEGFQELKLVYLGDLWVMIELSSS